MCVFQLLEFPLHGQAVVRVVELAFSRWVKRFKVCKRVGAIESKKRQMLPLLLSLLALLYTRFLAAGIASFESVSLRENFAFAGRAMLYRIWLRWKYCARRHCYM